MPDQETTSFMRSQYVGEIEQEMLFPSLRTPQEHRD
jgi:hypothetical protein